MSKDQADPSPEEAVERAREHLAEAVESIDSPEKAEAVLEQLLDDKAKQPAVDVAEEEASVPVEASSLEQAKEAAEAIEEAAEAEATDVAQAARVLEATAAEATALEGPAHEALAGEVQAVTAPVLREDGPEKLEEQRRHLRGALKKHPGVSLLQSYDTELFIFINNHIPRTIATDSFFYLLSAWFRGGLAWPLGLALTWPFYPEWAARTLKQVAPPIWIAGAIVEGPIKLYFRRKRPFIEIVRTIVVGKKPGNWSFPSGHSAVAFAGARMFSRVLPGWRVLWYGIAGLVGFSRVYLGAHYPGDVLSGSLLGVGLSEVARWFIKKVWGSS